MGGLNTWTPIRPFVPTYYNSPLLSDNINEIREHYGLDCNDESKLASNVPLFVDFIEENETGKHMATGG